MRSAGLSTVLPLFAPLLLAALAPGCAREEGPAGGVRVRGRLVDDETGEEVSRRGFWVHGFSDSVGKQVSLPSAPEPSFALVLPARDVRLRIFDASNAYRLYEQRFTAASDVLDVEVRLEPTHWIRLHGKVLWRDGTRLRPLREGDGNVRSARVKVGPGGLNAEADGSYSVRVPRDLHLVGTIDTNYEPHPSEVDLRGATGDEHALDVVLEPGPHTPR